MPVKRHRVHISLNFPSDWKWEFEQELHRLDQQRVKSKRGFRVSLSQLYIIALKEGINVVQRMNLEDVERWFQKHRI